MLLLAAVAARTSTVQLGTTSYLLPIRNSVLAAEQVAVLDQLSEGRLILGLGRGYQRGMLDAFGVSNTDKRERFGDILAGMRSAWRGEHVGASEHQQVLSPLPLQQPHPPLWVAAFGPKAISQVGSLGLPYLASPVESLTELQENYRRHAQALAEHEHSQPDTIAVMRTVFVSDDAEACDAILQKLAALPPPPFQRDATPAVQDCCLIGNPQQVREQIASYREALGMTHLIAVRPRVAGVAEKSLRDSFAALSRLR